MLDFLRLPQLLLVLCLGLAYTQVYAEPVAEFFGRQGSSHTNNWAVLVCASRYWFNYRVRGVCMRSGTGAEDGSWM